MELSDLKRKINREKVDKDILFTPQNSNEDLLFESIQMPHWSQFLLPNDLDTLYWVATNNRLASNFDKRKQYIEGVMNSRGFKFMAGGTNRMVYKHMEFPTIVAKIPIDRVGLNDNISELSNQRKIWPFCAKMIQVTPLGVVGFAERLEPILNRYQFNAFAPMIYITTIQLIGKYVLEDIGTDFFKNWGVRRGYGACLLDYPYLYELDGSKLICQQPMVNGLRCGGELDYDSGFNHLYCTKCGHRYHASELKLNISSETIKISAKRGGKKPMLVTFSKGDKILASSYDSDSIVRPATKHSKPVNSGNGTITATFTKGDKILSGTEEPIIPANNSSEIVSTTIDIDSFPKAEEEQYTPVIRAALQDVAKAIEEDTRIAEEIKQAFDAPTAKEVHIPIQVEKYDIEYHTPTEPIPAKVFDSTENIITDEDKKDDKKEESPKDVKSSDVPVDEFPPNQWKVPPTFGAPRRRIITSNNGSSNSSVQVRPNNPYKN